MAMKYPVLIVTYARPEGLRRIIEVALKAGVTQFYVAIDGPRNKEIEASQQVMHEYLDCYTRNVDLEINTWQRDENLGAASSVLTAINWFLGNEQAGIILEDDLVPSLDFFEFASLALDKYRDNTEVWSIAGSRILESNAASGVSDWSTYPMIWGWATWDTKWKTMYPLLVGKTRLPFHSLFTPTANFWAVGAKRAKRGMIDAWDIPLANVQRLSKKYSLIPPTNLVTNIGFDKNATHTRSESFPLNHPVEPLPLNYELPRNISEKSAKLYDKELMRRVYFLRKRHSLLRIWAFLTDSFRFRNQKTISLNDKLSRVRFPEEKL